MIVSERKIWNWFVSRIERESAERNNVYIRVLSVLSAPANYIVIFNNANFVIIFYHGKKAAQRRYNDNEICVESYRIGLLVLRHGHRRIGFRTATHKIPQQ